MSRIPQFVVSDVVDRIPNALKLGIVSPPAYVFIRKNGNLIYVDEGNEAKVIVGDNTASEEDAALKANQALLEAKEYAENLVAGREVAGTAELKIQYLSDGIISQHSSEIDNLKKRMSVVEERSEIVNTLDNNSTDKPLSAAQGKALSDKIEKVRQEILSEESIKEMVNERINERIRVILNGEY